MLIHSGTESFCVKARDASATKLVDNLQGKHEIKIALNHFTFPATVNRVTIKAVLEIENTNDNRILPEDKCFLCVIIIHCSQHMLKKNLTDTNMLMSV